MNPLVAYGSTMHGSEKIAKYIAEKYGVEARELNRVSNDDLLNAKIAIFVIATFGNGQFPQNCKEFCERLDGSKIDLSHLRFAELALGSNHYQFFCKAGEELHRMLTERGAKEIIPYVRSDKCEKDNGESVIEDFKHDAIDLEKAAKRNQQAEQKKPIVAFGSTMKGSEKVARNIAEQLGTEAVALNELSVDNLCQVNYAVFVVATFGNGDYPKNAGEFAETLRGSSVDLHKLKFALLALGSSKYPNFCKAGEDFYQILTYHGAKAVVPFVHSDKMSNDGGQVVIDKFITDSVNAKPKEVLIQASSDKPLVAYGSTMHGSEKIAKGIAEKFGIEAVELNEVSIDVLANSPLAIFIIGTIGNGHYPKNCQEFADRLTASRTDLQNTQFALLGLGSTYYELFCQASNNIYKLMTERGAKPIIPFAKSDKAAKDQGKSVIADFEEKVLSLKIEGQSQDEIKPLIAYGSTRHGSENIAKELAESLGVEAVELNRVKDSDLESAKVAIFIISTTGNGQYPMNCKAFCDNFLYSTADLRNLQYAELALGSSYYQYYCKAGDQLNKMLQNRGAKPLIPYAKSNKANEDFGEEEIASFKHDVLAAIGSFKPKPGSKVELKEIKDEKESHIIQDGFTEVEITSKTLLSVGDYAPRLWKYTVKLPSAITYAAGDHCLVSPQNDPEVVARVLEVLKLNPNTVFQITSSGSIILPPKASVKQLFTQFIDLNAKPSRQLFDLFRISNVAPFATVAELILNNASSIPNLIDLLITVTYIEPRTYSISSERKGELDLIVGDVSFNGHPGLCTHYLSLPSTKMLQIQTMKGLFEYPENLETPIIICALGSGISPVFSLLEHRKTGKPGSLGKCIVLFGTRYENASKKAIEELEEYQKKGYITKLCVAISREGKKQHIQNLIQEEEDAIWDLWQDEKAQIFYCGPPNSACDEVREILVKLALNKAKMTRTEAVWHCSHHKWCIEQF